MTSIRQRARAPRTAREGTSDDDRTAAGLRLDRCLRGHCSPAARMLAGIGRAPAWPACSPRAARRAPRRPAARPVRDLARCAGPLGHREGRQLVQLAGVHRRRRGHRHASDPARLHQGRPASRSPTPRTTTTTTSSSPRCKPQLQAGARTPAATSGAQHRLDGGPADPARLGAGAGQGQHPERRATSSRTCSDVDFDPGRQLLAAVAERLHRHRRTTPTRPAARRSSRSTQLLTDPTLKGKVTLLTEMRDTVGMVLLAQGKDPAKLHRRRLRRRDRRDSARPRTPGSSRGFTGNEYGKPLASGDIAACLAWTGDVVQLQADNPEPGLRPARDRPPALVRQLRHPQPGQAQEERRAADRPLLRARGHGRGRGVRQLHLAGQGRPGGPAGEGPGHRRQRADLPEPRRSSAARTSSAA